MLAAMPGLLHRLIATRTPRSVERDTVTVELAGERSLVVQRVRDPRARRLKLSVDERGARLTLPWRASLVSGDRFLQQHLDWLSMQLDRHLDADSLPSLQPFATATLPLRGEALPVHWQEGRYMAITRAADGLRIQLPPKVGIAALRRHLRAFYETEARADIGRWLPKYLAGLPRAPARIRLKMMSSQWGSLSPDSSMALDLSLVIGRPSAFEYVLVHELCHLIQANHSPAFWHQVELRCPEWPAEREYFHEHGRRLKATLRALLAG